MKYAQICVLILVLILSFSVFSAEIETLAGGCDSCHGPQGVSSESDVPTIAGQLASYSDATMKSYQIWGRPCIKSAYRHGDTSKPVTTMCAIAEGLDEQQIEALGQHYAAQKFVAARQDFDMEKASAGGDLHEIHCETCHAMGGSIAGRGPILAGQWAPYLKVAVRHSSTGEHLVPRAMENRLNKFSAEEIDALLNFYASQQNQ
jgi:sulfide dehydrogenase cytochrome subunit